MYFIYMLFICIAYLWVFNCFMPLYLNVYLFFLVFLWFFSVFPHLLRQQSRNVNFCPVLVKKTFFIHLRKQHSLYYEFCYGCSVRAFAENKTIMAKP